MDGKYIGLFIVINLHLFFCLQQPFFFSYFLFFAVPIPGSFVLPIVAGIFFFLTHSEVEDIINTGTSTMDNQIPSKF